MNGISISCRQISWCTNDERNLAQSTNYSRFVAAHWHVLTSEYFTPDLSTQQQCAFVVGRGFVWPSQINVDGCTFTSLSSSIDVVWMDPTGFYTGNILLLSPASYMNKSVAFPASLQNQTLKLRDNISPPKVTSKLPRFFREEDTSNIFITEHIQRIISNAAKSR